MDIDEIMAAANAGELLTDEEFARLEKKLLETTRTLFQMLTHLSDEMDDDEPELAERLRASASSMLLNVEAAAAIGGGPGKIADA